MKIPLIKNVQNAVKGVHKGKLIASNEYVRNKSFKISNL